jgi:hypothetical protein
MNRRLLLTGVALILGGAVGVSPLVAAWRTQSLPQFAVGLSIVLSGLVAVLLSRRNAEGRLVAVFHRFAIGALAVTLLSGFIEMFSQSVRMDSWTFFYIVNTLLISLGAPFLWGAALARRQEPGSLAAQKAGRLSAGAVQLGFIFLFAAEVRMLERFGNIGRSGAGLESALFALNQLVTLVERILILWASIESVRTAVDEEVIVRRAVRINRLMGGWLLLVGLSIILSHAHARVAYPGSMSLTEGYSMTRAVWRSAALLLLTFAGALAEFCRLTVRNAGPVTVATGNSASGAEA